MGTVLILFPNSAPKTRKRTSGFHGLRRSIGFVLQPCSFVTTVITSICIDISVEHRKGMRSAHPTREPSIMGVGPILIREVEGKEERGV